MMMTRLRVVACALVALAVSGAASADSLLWTFQSEHPNAVSLEFYSQDYDSAWPGNGEVFVIDDWAAHDYNLECETGELICYGAWVRGDSSEFWGVGIDNSEYCEDCCSYCGGAGQSIQLLP